MKRPISTPSTSTMNVAEVTRWPSKLSFSATAQRLPGAIVPGGDTLYEARSIPVFQGQQLVEGPVKVVGEVDHLVPQRIRWIQLHGDHCEVTSSIRPRRRGAASRGISSVARSSVARSSGWSNVG